MEVMSQRSRSIRIFKLSSYQNINMDDKSIGMSRFGINPNVQESDTTDGDSSDEAT
jgi:hypothetical protein